MGKYYKCHGMKYNHPKSSKLSPHCEPVKKKDITLKDEETRVVRMVDGKNHRRSEQSHRREASQAIIWIIKLEYNKIRPFFLQFHLQSP